MPEEITQVAYCVQCKKIYKLDGMKEVNFGREKYKERIEKICEKCYNVLS